MNEFSVFEQIVFLSDYGNNRDNDTKQNIYDTLVNNIQSIHSCEQIIESTSDNQIRFTCYQIICDTIKKNGFRIDISIFLSMSDKFFDHIRKCYSEYSIGSATFNTFCLAYSFSLRFLYALSEDSLDLFSDKFLPLLETHHPSSEYLLYMILSTIDLMSNEKLDFYYSDLFSNSFVIPLFSYLVKELVQSIPENQRISIILADLRLLASSLIFFSFKFESEKVDEIDSLSINLPQGLIGLFNIPQFIHVLFVIYNYYLDSDIHKYIWINILHILSINNNCFLNHEQINRMMVSFESELFDFFEDGIAYEEENLYLIMSCLRKFASRLNDMMVNHMTNPLMFFDLIFIFSGKLINIEILLHMPDVVYNSLMFWEKLRLCLNKSEISVNITSMGVALLLKYVSVLIDGVFQHPNETEHIIYNTIDTLPQYITIIGCLSLYSFYDVSIQIVGMFSNNSSSILASCLVSMLRASSGISFRTEEIFKAELLLFKTLINYVSSNNVDYSPESEKSILIIIMNILFTTFGDRTSNCINCLSIKDDSQIYLTFDEYASLLSRRLYYDLFNFYDRPDLISLVSIVISKIYIHSKSIWKIFASFDSFSNILLPFSFQTKPIGIVFNNLKFLNKIFSIGYEQMWFKDYNSLIPSILISYSDEINNMNIGNLAETNLLLTGLSSLFGSANMNEQYQRLFYWFYPDHLEKVLQMSSFIYQNPQSIPFFFRFLSSLCVSSGRRIIFTSTSGEGIVLFSKTSKVLIEYFECIYKYVNKENLSDNVNHIGKSFILTEYLLKSNYTMFNAFNLYKSTILIEFISSIINTIYSITMEQIILYPKLWTRMMKLLSTLCSKHHSLLNQESISIVIESIFMSLNSNTSAVFDYIPDIIHNFSKILIEMDHSIIKKLNSSLWQSLMLNRSALNNSIVGSISQLILYHNSLYFDLIDSIQNSLSEDTINDLRAFSFEKSNIRIIGQKIEQIRSLLSRHPNIIRID